MIDTIITTMFVILLSIAVMGLIYLALEDELKKAQQWFEYRLQSLRKKLTPKTPIQKEIEEKRKEIEKLQEHIKDMAELNSLEQKEKELFRKIADEDLKSRGIDTKTTTELHFKWCEVCGNAYTGGSCDCFNKRNDNFVWVPVSKDEMRFKRATYKMKDPLATHVEECPYCSAHSFEWEYKTDGMIQTCRNCETEVGMIKANSPIKETMI